MTGQKSVRACVHVVSVCCMCVGWGEEGVQIDYDLSRVIIRCTVEG